MFSMSFVILGGPVTTWSRVIFGDCQKLSTKVTASFVDLLCFFLSCVCYAYVRVIYMCLVVTCLERADLLALVCGVLL